MKSIILLALIAMTGCATLQQTPTTPPPTDEFKSFGSHSTKAGSYEVAFEAAQQFCDRWKSVPGVVSKELSYNGQLAESTNTAVNMTADAVRLIPIARIPGARNNDAYETTLVYKCY